MKKSIIVAILLAVGLLAGCNQQDSAQKESSSEKNDEVIKLEQKIEELELENSRLKVENLKIQKKLETLLKEQSRAHSEE